MDKVSWYIRQLMCSPIRLYQYLIRPILPDACRFYPSCSVYAVLALETHGVIRGLWLILCRLVRCHPWNKGGYDPVSQKKETF